MSGPLRIVMLTGDFSFPPYGGIATHVAGLTAGLAARGHDVRVVVPRYGAGEESRSVAGVKYVEVRRASSPRFVRYLRRRSAIRDWLRRQLADRPADVLHVHDFTIGPPIANGLGGASYVFTNHTSNFLDFAGYAPGRWFLRRLVGRPVGVISVSPDLERASALLAPAASELIPSGVDVDRFTPVGPARPLRDELGWKAGSPLALYVGRVHPVKGLDVLVAALAHLHANASGARLAVVGDGTAGHVRRLRTQIAAAGLDESVRLVGRVDHDALPAVYRAADVVCLPSRMEATSLTGLEAMACGRPLVATDVGGVPLLVTPGKTGTLVPPGDPAALAEALGAMFADASRRAAMGSASRRAATERFAWPIVAKRTEAFYRRVTALVSS